VIPTGGASRGITTAAIPGRPSNLIIGWHLIAWVLAASTTGVMPAFAHGRLLERCARGQLEVCFSLLARPRLDPGRRAAIEFHLAEVDKLAVACNGRDETACAELAYRYPDLPADLAPRSPKPDR
jgi:hypothetical protein